MSNFNYATHSTPINRNAANAMSGGCHYEARRDKNVPKPRSTPFKVKDTPEKFPKFEGRVFGRLGVVGFAGLRKDGKPIYAVRCQCGNYELRAQAKIEKGMRTGFGMCADCFHVERLRGRV